LPAGRSPSRRKALVSLILDSAGQREIMTKARQPANHHLVVTPRMIDSGLQALKKWKHLPPGELLAAVYRAMAARAAIDSLQSPTPHAEETAADILKRVANDC